MPLAPMSTELPTAFRSKIGFSIESIVGSGDTKGKESTESRAVLSSPNSSAHHIPHPRMVSSMQRTPSPEPASIKMLESSNSSRLRKNGSREILSSIAHRPRPHHFLNKNNASNGSLTPITIPLSSHQLCVSLSRPPGSNNSSANSSPGISSPSSTCNQNNTNNRTISNSSTTTDNRSNIRPAVTKSFVSSANHPSTSTSPSSSPKSNTPNSPVESLSRPLGILSHPPLLLQLHGIPAGPHPAMEHRVLSPQFAGYPPEMLNFAIAAAAAATQTQHYPGTPGWISGGHSHQPPHDHPLYPWFMAKHGRIFPHRFGPGPDLPGFLLHPFRKPKRIRTAFSPTQLLKLEHAFERNHYVVGAERKQLARSLSLSETQVKIWFQNKRTKHKRMEQEEESLKRSDRIDSIESGVSVPSADSSTRHYSEEVSNDEDIVMEDDYSDEEEAKSQ